jgi:hypothetical protein
MPRHVVVDGSNIATEGRALPSLAQLNEAVTAYIQEHPDDLITVVVDATFGHRIAPSEVAEFDTAVENNELVSPPAGAIGRGDAFVLTIANKAGAIILSNDSFQEFHGDYPWLFDDGRLIGGKPVPHVGWVFVPRAPVRGPASRKATRGGKKTDATVAPRTRRRASTLASEPLPVPTVPPPRPVRRKAAARSETPVPAPGGEAAGTRAAPTNDFGSFVSFVEHHPVGASVEATVESYSSHGAYVSVDGVRAYVPLRFMGDPAPRSAREIFAVGERARFEVVSFAPGRRGIDLAVPGYAPVPAGGASKRAAKKATVVDEGAAAAPVKRARKKAAPAEELAVREPVKRTRKKAAPVADVAATPEPVKRTRKRPPAEPLVEEPPPAPAKAPRRRRATA